MDWLIYILASAILLSVYTPLMKHALAHEKTEQIIAIYPLVAAAIIPFIADIDYGIMLTSTGWLLFLKAFAIGLTLFCANLALERMPVSIYAPLRNFSPVILLFLGWLLLGESISIIQIFGLVLIVGGALFLDVDIRKRGQMQKLKKFFKHRTMLLILLASVAISFSPIFDRLILKQTDTMTALFWYLLIMAAMFWVVTIARTHSLPVQHIEKNEWPWLIIMGLVILGSDYLYFKAIQIPGTILVVIVGTRRLSNLFTTIIGGKLFHEDHILYRSMMCLLMIIGTVLLVV
ncbi:DMT family transporter [Candidatus Woesearchaeota archaeon]|nr:DMT family transporter [Candidatus Woesearchaeota archaeon]